MIRLPSGPSTSGATTGTGGTSTPTTNTAPSPVTSAMANQPMQVLTSNTQSPSVGGQSITGPGPSSVLGPTNSNSGGVNPTQAAQQQQSNPVAISNNGTNKNGFNRSMPSPAQGQTGTNLVQQPSTGTSLN